jgi:hypothetical protein
MEKNEVLTLIDKEVWGYQQAIEALLAVKKNVESVKPADLKYSTWSKMEAISDILAERKELVTYDELWEVAVRRGLDCRGIRDLKTTVTMNPKVLFSDGDRVGLMEWRRKAA